MDKLITYVGLDVRKDTVVVAVAEAGKRGEVREHGKIANPTLDPRPRQLRDASQVRRQPTRASEHDQPSSHDRASCPTQQRLR